MKHIAIFASGNGSNAQKIIEYFQGNPSVKISLIVSNNPNAYVLQRAKTFNIPAFSIKRKDFYETDEVVNKLREEKIDLIVLAGFLLLIPENLLKAFPNRIVNIHPALLPKYGGKGMYGDKVHEAVKSSGDEESGITIHYLNEKYDDGEIIFQAKISVSPDDTSLTIAGKVHTLEHEHYPKVIEQILSK